MLSVPLQCLWRVRTFEESQEQQCLWRARAFEESQEQRSGPGNRVKTPPLTFGARRAEIKTLVPGDWGGQRTLDGPPSTSGQRRSFRDPDFSIRHPCHSRRESLYEVQHAESCYQYRRVVTRGNRTPDTILFGVLWWYKVETREVVPEEGRVVTSGDGVTQEGRVPVVTGTRAR